MVPRPGITIKAGPVTQFNNIQAKLVPENRQLYKNPWQDIRGELCVIQKMMENNGVLNNAVQI